MPGRVLTGNVSELERFAGMDLHDKWVGRLTLSNDTVAQLELPRDFPYAGLELHCAGTFTVAGGSSSGTLNDENPMSYLDRIIVDATGGESSIQLKNAKGIHFFRRRHLRDGIEPVANPIVSAGAQAATAFSCIIPIDFALAGVNFPSELKARSLLNPAEFSKLMLELRPIGTGAFVNGGDRTLTVNTFTVDVVAKQAYNVEFAGYSPMKYIETFFSRETVAATATQRRIGGGNSGLAVGRPYLDLLLVTRDESSNARKPVDDTLGDVTIMLANSQLERYTSFREIAHRNRMANRVDAARNPSGLNALSTADNPVVGNYLFDFARDGRLEGILNTTRFPASGVVFDFLHDVDTASSRVIEAVSGQIISGRALTPRAMARVAPNRGGVLRRR